MSENLVIIPTYKEKENIEKIIRYVFNLPMAFDILIIDDTTFAFVSVAFTSNVI